jgi:hypothetical protein
MSFIKNQLLSAVIISFSFVPPALSQTPSSTVNCTDLQQVRGPVISFGQGGGFVGILQKVEVDARGEVTYTASGIQKKSRVSPSTVTALVKLANAEGFFWEMSESQPDKVHPNVPRSYININLPCVSRTIVTAPGDGKTGIFPELYSVLSDLFIPKK